MVQAPAEAASEAAVCTLRGEKGSGGSPVLCAGTCVEALYDDGLWYEGRIESHDSTTGRYKITLQDGETVTTPLPDDNFRVLSSAGPEHGKNCASPPVTVFNGNGQV